MFLKFKIIDFRHQRDIGDTFGILVVFENGILSAVDTDLERILGRRLLEIFKVQGRQSRLLFRCVFLGLPYLQILIQFDERFFFFGTHLLQDRGKLRLFLFRLFSAKGIGRTQQDFRAVSAFEDVFLDQAFVIACRDLFS